MDEPGVSETFLTDLFRDPPLVHELQREGHRQPHVWHTDTDCYRLIANRVGARSRTLETGCGVSTALFAALGCEHTAVFGPGSDEGRLLRQWCDRKEVPTDRLRLLAQASADVLPTLTEPLDLVLIDGCHGFPTPVLDWYYGGRLLRPGGLLVVDDLHLPAVAVLQDFLDADPRWEGVAAGRAWAAWERAGSGGLGEEWTEQGFWRSPASPGLGRRAGTKARRLLGRRPGEHVVLPVA